MEGLVKIIEEKCKVCYACVRACPVNAIKVSNEATFPVVVPERCIGCGSCIRACNPEAIVYHDSIPEVRKILKSGKKSVIALDPSISAEFPDIADYRKLVRMIRVLGFTYVLDTAFGVDLVAAAYNRLLSNFKGKYYIFANDPVVVNYIEKFQPELIPNLAPIVSPAVSTALLAREIYGEDIKVVFAGPLIASKKSEEMGSGKGRIDSVITFSELRELFREFSIDQKQLEFSDFDPPHGNKGILFPIAEGFLQAAGIEPDLLEGKVTTVEGEQEMKEALKEFEESIETINSHFNIFYNEYLMGPGTSRGGQKYIRQAEVKIYSRKRLKHLDIQEWGKNLEIYKKLDLSRTFTNDDQRLPFPSDQKIREIMEDLKKDCDDDMGCGACGYESCRDFAIAIAKGLATPEMCNQYTTRNRQEYIQSLKISNDKLAQAEKALRESESIARKEKESAKEASEIITAMLQKLPSGLVILDEKLKILQANQSFIDMLGEDAKEINEVIPGLAGADLKTLLPYSIYNLFTYVLSNNENIQNRDISYKEQLLNASVFVIRKSKIVGAVFRDMYSPEVRKEEVIKRVTEVIDKNLSLVQQIGFLLGEGASETEKMLNSIIEFYKDPTSKDKE
ncbi:MAG: [Fe-Fe] hydrogenase large subunit C-terminal domain-containing protein [Bacteroidales bacterium]